MRVLPPDATEIEKEYRYFIPWSSIGLWLITTGLMSLESLFKNENSPQFNQVVFIIFLLLVCLAILNLVRHLRLLMTKEAVFFPNILNSKTYRYVPFRGILELKLRHSRLDVWLAIRSENGTTNIRRSSFPNEVQFEEVVGIVMQRFEEARNKADSMGNGES